MSTPTNTPWYESPLVGGLLGAGMSYLQERDDLRPATPLVPQAQMLEGGQALYDRYLDVINNGPQAPMVPQVAQQYGQIEGQLLEGAAAGPQLHMPAETRANRDYLAALYRQRAEAGPQVQIAPGLEGQYDLLNQAYQRVLAGPQYGIPQEVEDAYMGPTRALNAGYRRTAEERGASRLAASGMGPESGMWEAAQQDLDRREFGANEDAYSRLVVADYQTKLSQQPQYLGMATSFYTGLQDDAVANWMDAQRQLGALTSDEYHSSVSEWLNLVSQARGMVEGRYLAGLSQYPGLLAQARGFFENLALFDERRNDTANQNRDQPSDLERIIAGLLMGASQGNGQAGGLLQQIRDVIQRIRNRPASTQQPPGSTGGTAPPPSTGGGGGGSSLLDLMGAIPGLVLGGNGQPNWSNVNFDTPGVNEAFFDTPGAIDSWANWMESETARIFDEDRFDWDLDDILGADGGGFTMPEFNWDPTANGGDGGFAGGGFDGFDLGGTLPGTDIPSWWEGTDLGQDDGFDWDDLFGDISTSPGAGGDGPFGGFDLGDLPTGGGSGFDFDLGDLGGSDMFDIVDNDDFWNSLDMDEPVFFDGPSDYDFGNDLFDGVFSDFDNGGSFGFSDDGWDIDTSFDFSDFDLDFGDDGGWSPEGSGWGSVDVADWGGVW